MTEKIIFKTRSIFVSDRLFRTPRRSYRLSDIEKLTIKRPLFLTSLPLAVGCYFLLKEYAPYLYQGEKAFCVAMFTVAPFLSWFIGTLSVTSKSLRDDDAITGYMPTLRKAREAIEEVIFSSNDNQNLLEADDEQL